MRNPFYFLREKNVSHSFTYRQTDPDIKISLSQFLLLPQSLPRLLNLQGLVTLIFIFIFHLCRTLKSDDSPPLTALNLAILQVFSAILQLCFDQNSEIYSPDFTNTDIVNCPCNCQCHKSEQLRQLLRKERIAITYSCIFTLTTLPISNKGNYQFCLYIAAQLLMELPLRCSFCSPLHIYEGYLHSFVTWKRGRRILDYVGMQIFLAELVDTRCRNTKSTIISGDRISYTNIMSSQNTVTVFTLNIHNTPFYNICL